MNDLYLKFPSMNEKEKFVEYIKEYRFDNPNAKPLGCTENINYEEWLKKIDKERNGIDLEEGRVPSTVYFLMDANDRILAHISIRHSIDNDFLRLYGGHIGYGVRPSERKKEYATIMLHLALIKCKELGIDDVMISCKESNIASAKTIENNFGVQKELIYIEDEKMNFKKYWINVEESINNFENKKGKSL
jgi:predicted acetyltransferase